MEGEQVGNQWARDAGLKPMNGYVSSEASEEFKALARELQLIEKVNHDEPELTIDGRPKPSNRNREILEFVLWHGIFAVREKIGRGS